MGFFNIDTMFFCEFFFVANIQKECINILHALTFAPNFFVVLIFVKQTLASNFSFKMIVI